MTDDNSITYKIDEDAMDRLEVKLEQLHALAYINVGNKDFGNYKRDVADNYFLVCSEIADQALEELKRAVVRT